MRGGDVVANPEVLMLNAVLHYSLVHGNKGSHNCGRTSRDGGDMIAHQRTRAIEHHAAPRRYDQPQQHDACIRHRRPQRSGTVAANPQWSFVQYMYAILPCTQRRGQTQRRGPRQIRGNRNNTHPGNTHSGTKYVSMPVRLRNASMRSPCAEHHPSGTGGALQANADQPSQHYA